MAIVGADWNRRGRVVPKLDGEERVRRLHLYEASDLLHDRRFSSDQIKNFFDTETSYLGS